MISEVVARRYAKALFLATAPDDLEGTAEELKRIAELLSSQPQLKGLLGSPAVQPAKKQGIVDAVIARAGLSELLTRFLRLLVEKSRTDHLDRIAASYGVFVDEKLNRVNARVVLAEEPRAAQLRRLTASLKAITGKSKVMIHKEIDPDILGGFIIRIGDQVYDASVRNELARIERTLAD